MAIVIALAIPLLTAGWEASLVVLRFVGNMAWKPLNSLRLPLLFSLVYYTIGTNFIQGNETAWLSELRDRTECSINEYLGETDSDCVSNIPVFKSAGCPDCPTVSLTCPDEQCKTIIYAKCERPEEECKKLIEVQVSEQIE